jgi:hypothetical protein
MSRVRASRFALLLLAACGVVTLPLAAQGVRTSPVAQAPPTAQAAAPIDLTGNWVAVISEDWRWRMVTPAKGDYASVPLTPEGLKLADTWDPVKDEAAGEQCRSYGAPGLMRGPIRMRLSWLDASTLKVETDYGMQTRLLHFGNWTAPRTQPTWQGNSVAKWVTPALPSPPGTPMTGSLTVTTDRLRPGYLRKNGVPYSADAQLTEFWDTTTDPGGNRWVVITSIVHDPKYLLVPFTTSLQFKKEGDGSKWDPTPCSARW